jgi:hypothetical protein
MAIRRIGLKIMVDPSLPDDHGVIAMMLGRKPTRMPGPAVLVAALKW